jgi:hypothetical protein
MALLAPIFYLYQTQWNKPLNSKNWTRKYKKKKRREEPKKTRGIHLPLPLSLSRINLADRHVYGIGKTRLAHYCWAA